MWKIVSLIMATGLVLSMMITACQPEPDAAPQVGKLAPEFQLPSLEGEVVSFSGLWGNPVMLNFWATWCGPCRLEIPYIQELHEEWRDKDLAVLTVNVGENPSQVEEFMAQNQLTFPVLLDVDGEVSTQYSVRGIPTTVFIDSEGVIRVIKVGAFSSKAAIERDLSKIISLP
ncbi:TlpA family protein disulfide reductase [Chloroflexota bacterium]